MIITGSPKAAASTEPQPATATGPKEGETTVVIPPQPLYVTTLIMNNTDMKKKNYINDLLFS